MKSRVNPSPALQRGFSLVELMVGITIALIAILVMQQTVVFYDGQKRGTSGGADAQNTGMVAMYTLESDFRLAGYGLTTLDTMYCIVQAGNHPDIPPFSGTPSVGTPFSFNGHPLIPVMIIPDGMPRINPYDPALSPLQNPFNIPPGDAGSDILAVTYGHTAATPEGVPIVGLTGTTIYKFGKNLTGFNAGDYILAAQAGQPCTLARIDTINAATRELTVDHASTGATYAANTTNVFNLGSAGLTMRVYAVRNANLTVCDAWANDCSSDLSAMTASAINALWVPIASNVVGLRAQYGWDTSGTADMRVDAYCRSHLTSGSPICPLTDNEVRANAANAVPQSACDWSRIATLRVALVARSAEKAPGGVNVSDPTITLWPDSAGSTAPVFTVPSQQYRYKVFQSTIPIRNVIWLGAQSTCP